MRNDLEIIILAAGKGSRMKTKIPKVLNKLRGKSLVEHVIEKSKKLKPKKINLIINKNLNNFLKKNSKMNFFIQSPSLGTGHALQLYNRKGKNIKKYLIVLNADTPLINYQDILLVYKKLKKNSDLVILGAKINHNRSQGIIVEKKGKVSKIVEFLNATSKERKSKLCSTGVIGLKSKFLHLSKKIKKNKNKNEYLITDIFGIAYQKKLAIGLIKTKNSLKSLGINTVNELNKLNR